MNGDAIFIVVVLGGWCVLNAYGAWFWRRSKKVVFSKDAKLLRRKSHG